MLQKKKLSFGIKRKGEAIKLNTKRIQEENPILKTQSY